MLVVVNSHAGGTAARTLLHQLGQLGMPTLHVSGGEKRTAWYNVSRTLQRLDVQHDSIDFTGIIALLEHPQALKNEESFFYLHDTTTIDALFHARLTSLTYHGTCALGKHPSNNIGVYSVSDLLQHRSRILAMRSTSHPSACERLEIKRKGFDAEDVVFKLVFAHYRQEWCALSARSVLKTPSHFYSNTTKRIRVIYKDWGIVKYSANWEGHRRGYYVLSE